MAARLARFDVAGDAGEAPEAPVAEAPASVIGFGYDSIYISSQQPLREGLLEELGALRERSSKVDDPKLWVTTVLDDGGEDRAPLELVVTPHRPKYADCLLQSDAISVVLARGHTRPSIRMQVHSVALWQMGAQHCIELVKRIVAAVGAGAPMPMKVSRADLAADFSGWDVEPDYDPWTTRARNKSEFHTGEDDVDDGDLEVAWKTKQTPLMRGRRAQKGKKHVDVVVQDRTRHQVGRQFSGFTFGSKALLCRIYNKSLEIKVSSQKTWMASVWRGYDGAGDVWRCEYQLRRGVLKELGINTPDELLECTRSLWRWLSSNWLSHRHPRTAGTRRTYTERWKALQRAPALWADEGSSTDLVRVRVDHGRAYNEAQLIGTISRCIAFTDDVVGGPKYIAIDETTGETTPLPTSAIAAALAAIEHAEQRGDPLEQRVRRVRHRVARSRAALARRTGPPLG